MSSWTPLRVSTNGSGRSSSVGCKTQGEMTKTRLKTARDSPPSFPRWETEAQGRAGTCMRSHSLSRAEVALPPVSGTLTVSTMWLGAGSSPSSAPHWLCDLGLDT